MPNNWKEIQKLSESDSEDAWQAILYYLKTHSKGRYQGAVNLMESKRTASDNPQSELYMLTINLPTEELAPLKALTEKVVRWRSVYQWAYCYELTRARKPHSHILLKINDVRKFKQNLSRQRYKFPAIKFNRFSDWDNGITYLSGFKKNEKKPMFDQDIIFRRKYNLDNIYQSE